MSSLIPFQTPKISSFFINGVEIHADENGRFRLSDLHKASGGLEKHKPANWLRQQQINDLLEVLESEHHLEPAKIKPIEKSVEAPHQAPTSAMTCSTPMPCGSNPSSTWK